MGPSGRFHKQARNDCRSPLTENLLKLACNTLSLSLQPVDLFLLGHLGPEGIIRAHHGTTEHVASDSTTQVDLSPASLCCKAQAGCLSSLSFICVKLRYL